jgi:DNA polymerase-3 subunit delta'
MMFKMIDVSLPPKLQKQIIGFKDHFDRLKTLETKGILHPAWLLSGQRGIGKATFAYNFARYLLADLSDNQAFYTMLIDQGSHPNLLVLEKSIDEDGKPEVDIKIDQARKLVDFAHQSPAVPGWRIVIIDSIDEMNRNAANSLLKILEEPPQKFLFLMVCHSMGAILPTIRSRCNIFPLTPLTPEELTHSGINIDPYLLNATNGSIGAALAMQSINVEEFCRTVTNIISDLNRGSTLKLTSYITSLDKKEPSVKTLPDILEWITREAALCANGIKSSNLIKDLAVLKDPEHWVRANHLLNRYLYLAKGSHPDPIHLIQGVFLMIDNPHIVHLEQLG